VKREQELRPDEAVGRSVPRPDGVAKVTGRAKYLDDITFEGQLHGRTVRARAAHARVTRLEQDPKYDWSGITFVTARDIPGDNVVNLIEDDQPFLADGIVRHFEEPIALIAGADPERLEEALAHVLVEYEPLPPVLDAGKADHVFKSYRIEKDPEKLAAAFELAHAVVEETYVVRHQEQMYIEPNAVCAVPRGDGGVTLYGSLQCPFYVHRALQRLLKVGDDRLAVIQTVTGGGFGGKEEYPSIIAGHAALLAQKAKRPVKIAYGREEDVAATTKRHPAVVTHRTAVAKDGTLLGCEIDVLMDGGAYCTLSPVVLSRGTLHAAGAYRWPAARITSRVVRTNTAPNGAFRGFGAPQTLFAVEMQMEKIARALSMDPVELRRRNLLRQGDVTVTGQTLKYSVGAAEVLDKVAVRTRFSERRRKATDAGGPEPRRRGLGLSLVLHGAGFTGSGEAKLKARAGVTLTEHGCCVLSASTDIGQGAATVFSQMAADALGIPVDAVEVLAPDTSRVPDSGPTVASRTTMVVGGTITQAALAMRRALCAFVAEKHGLPAERVSLDGGAFHDGVVSLEPFPVAARRYLAERGPLTLIEQYLHPAGTQWDDATYRGDAYPVFSWAANVVEVELDVDTGEVLVVKITSANDVGRAIHPVLCAGQVEGGVVQALGYALLEELKVEGGRYLNTRLQNYVIPTSMDAPPIETLLVENAYPHGPYGAKGVGEMPMDGPAPAICAAILDACGAFIPELPASPERVLDALTEGK
jgi:CO/xanthine dehydrogenase Mo-binding subunit